VTSSTLMTLDVEINSQFDLQHVSVMSLMDEPLIAATFFFPFSRSPWSSTHWVWSATRRGCLSGPCPDVSVPSAFVECPEILRFRKYLYCPLGNRISSVIRIFLLFAVKLGHFVINYFFLYVINTEVWMQKLENKEKVVW